MSVLDPDPNPDPYLLGLLDPDPDPLIRGMDPGPGPDPSMTKKNSKENLDSYCFVTFSDFLSPKNDVNVPSKSKKQKHFKPDPHQNVMDPLLGTESTTPFERVSKD